MADGQRSALARAWQYLKLLFGGALALVAVLGLVVPEDEHLKRYAELEAVGVHVTAMVTDKSATDNIPAAQMGRFGPVGGFAGGAIAGYKLNKALDGQSGVIDNALASYAIKYEFRTPEGKLVANATQVSVTAYDALSVGAKVDVIYHPNSPTVHRLSEHSKPYAPIDPKMKLIAAVMFMGIGLLIVWRNWPSRGADAGGNSSRMSQSARMAAASAPLASARLAAAGRAPRRAGFGQR